MTSVPPLLVMAAGGKPRLRRVRMPTEKELKLQFTVAKMLDVHLLRGWRYTHFPAGEYRDGYTGGKLKRMGLKKGWPDFLIVNGETRLMHCLELKREGEVLKRDQESFRLFCVTYAIPHCVAYSLDDVCMIFDEWRCLRIRFCPE